MQRKPWHPDYLAWRLNHERILAENMRNFLEWTSANAFELGIRLRRSGCKDCVAWAARTFERDIGLLTRVTDTSDNF